MENEVAIIENDRGTTCKSIRRGREDEGTLGGKGRRVG